jgi:hypothetical protein
MTGMDLSVDLAMLYLVWEVDGGPWALSNGASWGAVVAGVEVGCLVVTS